MYGLHLIHTPNEKYTFVGSVPIGLMQARKPTQSDIMGGRVHNDGMAYVVKVYDNVDAAISDAKTVTAKLCDNVQCACRKLF